MAVLVTGGAGYIGSHMVWELLDAGEDVVVLDRLSTGFDWAVPQEARLVVGDIGESSRWSARSSVDYGIDAIIHFAGSIVVPESIADPLGYYENNTSKTRTLLEAAVAAKVPHIIFSSTAAVYGSAGMAAVREDHPLEPQSPYGVSKLMSEWMLRDASAAHGFHYTALRYFNVAGADPRGRTGQSTPGATHLLKVACETALGKRPFMQVYGTDYPTPDGTGIRDYIHVSDLVAAHRLALARLRAGGGNLVANCGYGHGCFRAGAGRQRAARAWQGFRGAHGTAPAGRPGGGDRQFRAGAPRARLAAALRRSRPDRDGCAFVGAHPCGQEFDSPLIHERYSWMVEQ